MCVCVCVFVRVQVCACVCKSGLKTENTVPVDKNQNLAQEIRFLKTSFRLSPMSLCVCVCVCGCVCVYV